MTYIKTIAIVALVTAGSATVATAAPTGGARAPLDAAATGLAPASLSKAQYYRRHHRRSYGTGYRGRGTRTGGPAGGLPSRN